MVGGAKGTGIDEGDPTPSAEDKRITRRLYEAGQILGIEVLDHIVIGEKGRSFPLKEGAMNLCRRSVRAILHYLASMSQANEESAHVPY